MFVRFVSVYFLWFYLLRVRVIPLARSPNSIISLRYAANTRSTLVYETPWMEYIKSEHPRTDRMHHAFIVKKLLDDR